MSVIVKSFSVGDGDTFYIRHSSDNFSIIDCCLSENEREAIVDEIIYESSGKGIKRFISTHPDEDHIHGLKYLDSRTGILNFYCVENEATKNDCSEDFEHYQSLRDSNKAYYIFQGCSRKWMNVTDDERGSAGISILWPDTSNKYYQAALAAAKTGNGPNNISPIIRYGLKNGAEVLWMGDLEHEFMKNVQDELTIEPVDILFAPHHGRASGKVPEAVLKQIAPQIVVIGEAPSEHLNYYGDYNTITQNSAGDIVFDCDGDRVHVYVSSETYSVNFLDDENKPDHDRYGSYIGTLVTRASTDYDTFAVKSHVKKLLRNQRSR